MKNTEILDVGCGHLPTGTPWAHKKRGTIGVDIKKAKGYADLLAEAQALPFRDNSFPKVISYWVIEHVLDVAKAIHEMIRVSSDEVYIVTDNALFYRVQLLKLLGCKQAYAQREHVHAFFPLHTKHFLKRIGVNAQVYIDNIQQLHKLDKIMIALSRIIPNLRDLVKSDIVVKIRKRNNMKNVKKSA